MPVDPRSAEAPAASADVPCVPGAVVVASEALFQGGREVLIRHGAECYRLRITSSGKLILTK